LEFKIKKNNKSLDKIARKIKEGEIIDIDRINDENKYDPRMYRAELLLN